MNTLFLKAYIKLQTLAVREDGQDLVEYALILALIATVCTAAVSGLATRIGTALNGVL